MDWRIGKIDELFCSEDGEVRSAEIAVKINGRKLKLRRPINKLYPFKCSTDKDEVKLKFVKDEGTKVIEIAGKCVELEGLNLLKEV